MTTTPMPSGDLRRRLGPRRWARLEGWGMAVSALGYLFKPRTVDQVRDLFVLASETQTPVTLRGGGRSYGDAAIGQDCIVLDLTRLNRILDWDPQTGIANGEPGVTLEQFWKSIIGDGWWPAVVSGTMFTTFGGCAAMNIHGKNNYRIGPFGDQVLDFDFLLPTGDTMTCSREQNADLFHAAISGFGMLGCFTRIRLKAKKVYSGNLRVEALPTRSIRHMMAEFEERAPEADYLVGWIDCTSRPPEMGRGMLHRADYLPPGADPKPRESLVLRAQELPSKIFGVPKSMLWWPLGFFTNNPGMGFVNTAKYHAGFIQPRGAMYLQAHAAFAFLLDYVPNWKWAYKPGGLIQYQSFVPKARAARVFEKLLRMTQKAGMPSYLGVLKKHRPDDFLLTHAVDGYSLALDFRVTKNNRTELWNLCHRMDEVVLEAGGRFYFAKDATLQAQSIPRFLPAENLAAFAALKKRCDPQGLLQTELSRRLFSEIFAR